MDITESPTIRSLAENFAADSALANECRVMVWDNSPEALSDLVAPFPFEYRHSGTNLGVSGAYNGALKEAEKHSIPWLLLLDQDTHLPSGYVRKMLEEAGMVEGQQDIAAVVPFVRSEGVLVSPRVVARFLRTEQVPRDITGRIEDSVTAVNSGSLMRVSALRSVGGYSDRYWLDLSDTYVFRRLYTAGFRIFVCGDVELEHSIATLNYDRDMTPARYTNFLAAENSFADEMLSRSEAFGYTILLFLRAQRQRRRFANKFYASITIRTAWFRLFHGRVARAHRWVVLLQSRDLPDAQT